MLENTFMDFFCKQSAQNRWISGFCEISLKGSINYLFEHSDLTKVIFD